MPLLTKSLREHTTGFTNVYLPIFFVYCSIYQLTGLTISSIINCDPSLRISDSFTRKNSHADNAVPPAYLRRLQRRFFCQNCVLRKNICSSETITNPQTGVTIKINNGRNCQSSRLMYTARPYVRW